MPPHFWYLARFRCAGILNRYGSREGTIASRLERLADAYIEGKIEKDLHDERRASLLAERQKVTDALANIETDNARGTEFLLKCLQLAKEPENLYLVASDTEKRRLLEIMTSNRTASGKNVEVAIAEPFCFLAKARENSSCALGRNRTCIAPFGGARPIH